MKNPIQRYLQSASLGKKFLLLGILGNFLWFFLYFQLIWRSERLENVIVQFYVEEKATQFVLISYLRDMGLFAYLIFSMVFFWRITKSGAVYSLLKDAIRAMIILFVPLLVLLQFLLFFSYMLGPISW